MIIPHVTCDPQYEMVRQFFVLTFGIQAYRVYLSFESVFYSYTHMLFCPILIQI